MMIFHPSLEQNMLTSLVKGKATTTPLNTPNIEPLQICQSMAGLGRDLEFWQLKPILVISINCCLAGYKKND